jgi:hypothetical protein
VEKIMFGLCGLVSSVVVRRELCRAVDKGS